MNRRCSWSLICAVTALRLVVDPVNPLRCGEDEAVLVKGGLSRCQVVALGPEVGNAARELIEYVQEMSGGKVPIVDDISLLHGHPIFVGGHEAVAGARAHGLTMDKAAWDSLSSEGYLIRCSGGILLLAGKSELSVRYAVDRLLENHLGVRWYLPGNLGEVVPKSTTLRLGEVEETGEPAFRWRRVGWGEWALRNGMNVQVGCQGEFETKWSVHTFSRLLPPKEYFDGHPEYYALVNGKRDRGESAQLCTSNPQVARVVAKSIQEIKKSEPNLRMISLDPMDTRAFCECPSCKALDEAGASFHNRMTRRLVLFHKGVSEVVRATQPDLFIKSIAYHLYAAPPLDRSVRMNPNGVVQLCRFMCHNHTLADPHCEYNLAYDKYLREWGKISENVAMYEYFYKVSWLELPWPIVHTIRKDIPYLKQLGLFGLATQCHENFGSNGLVYYIGAKLLWNPRLDVDALLEEFYTKFYAEAAGPMREYYETLEEAAIASGIHLARQRPYREVVKLFTSGLLKKLDRCVSGAEEKAGDEKVRKRVALVRASLDYARICAEYLRALERVQKEGGLPWTVGQAVDRARKVGKPYLEKIEQALEHGREIKATGGPDNPYIKRLLDPAGVLRSWNKPEYGFPLPENATQKKAWLAAEGLRGGNGELPDALSIWVVGYDFDAGIVQSECNLWTIGPDGRKIMLGGLAPARDSGNKQDRCYVFQDLETSALIRLRENPLLFITNPSGGWADAALYAVYLMPADTRLTSSEAMKRIEDNIDNVRERALGFVEFQGSGVPIPDGKTVALEIEVVR